MSFINPAPPWQSYLSNADPQGLLRWLRTVRRPESGNELSDTNLSLLYSVLAAGWGATEPELLGVLLGNQALIRDGKQPGPSQLPKRLTAHANARNVEYIFKKTASLGLSAGAEDLYLEIGAGDGYLKYLMTLGNTGLLGPYFDRLIESEEDAALVEVNRARGKFQLSAGFRETLTYFPPGSLKGVVSMNVLDIFSSADLTAALSTGRELLKPGGWYLHIMSSAIHPAVFRNLATAYPGRVLLPYQQEGFVGVRLAAGQFLPAANPLPTPTQLAELFANQPQSYLQAADEISRAFATSGQAEHVLLLKDFSLGRIMQAAQAEGYNVLACEEISSCSLVEPEACHAALGDLNSFTNKVGTLFTDKDEDLPPGKIRESSSFAFLLLQRE